MWRILASTSLKSFTNANRCLLWMVSNPLSSLPITAITFGLLSSTRSGIPISKINFTGNGPDIIAAKSGEKWKIECKGLGSGLPQTLRNNFDRTLASTVSYFDQDEGLRIGMAMPSNHNYNKLIRSKIPTSLRTAVNLWIFIYDRDKGEVVAYEPGKLMN